MRQELCPSKHVSGALLRPYALIHRTRHAIFRVSAHSLPWLPQHSAPSVILRSPLHNRDLLRCQLVELVDKGVDLLVGCLDPSLQHCFFLAGLRQRQFFV